MASDKGSEFYNEPFRSLLEEHQTELYSTCNYNKNSATNMTLVDSSNCP